MKKYFGFIIIFYFINCSSFSFIQLKQSPKDKEVLKTFDKSKLKIDNKRVFVLSNISKGVNDKFAEAIYDSTVELIDSLGGTEVIERRNLEKILEERKLVEKTNLTDLALNQKLGTDDGIIEITKWIEAEFAVSSALTNVKYDVEVQEAKDGTKIWILILKASVSFKVFKIGSTESKGIIYSEEFDHRLVKGFKYEPSVDSVVVMLPRVIEQCFEDVKPELQKIFPLKSLVVALKGEKKAAILAVGSENKIRKERIFIAKDKEGNNLAKFKVTDSNPDNSIAKVGCTWHSQKIGWYLFNSYCDLENLKLGTEVLLEPEELSMGYKVYRFLDNYVFWYFKLMIDVDGI